MRLSKQKVEELLSILGSTDPSERVFLCSESLYIFAKYYFSEYFKYKSPDFHQDLFDDFEALVNGEMKYGAWIAFAEAAKTSIAKIGLVWINAYKKKKYVNVDSNDKENAERLLFDVVLSMQTNTRLKNDFGHMYNAARSKDEVTIKRIANFITNNGIRYEAHSTQSSVRGRVHGEQRPDFFLLDDIENSKTIRSIPVTQSVISHYDEVKRGLAPDASMLLLGNYLIEEGSVNYVMESTRNSGGTVRFIPVVDKKGNIAWPDKYVKTDAEAFEINKTRPKEKQIVSLENKKRELNAGGKRAYEVEMMLDPIAAGSAFFDRRLIDIAIDKAIAPIEDKAGFWLWSHYKPANAYAVGADTGKGNGGDHSTSTLIDFTSLPNRQVGSYANNLIPADQFAYELKRQANMFGGCLLGPEKNAESGGSCLSTLKMIYPVDMIYRKVEDDRMTDKPVSSGEIGWETTGANKYTILNDLKSAFESGGLIIEDARILKEMRSFTYTDVDDLGSSRQGHSTRHFDLLMSTAIAWAMRKYAVPVTTVSNYEQPAYVAPGFE